MLILLHKKQSYEQNKKNQSCGFFYTLYKYQCNLLTSLLELIKAGSQRRQFLAATAAQEAHLSLRPCVPSCVRTQLVFSKCKVSGGCLWQHLATFGNFWQLLPTFANFWQLLAAFDNIWQLWQHLATFGNFWHLLASFGNFW